VKLRGEVRALQQTLSRKENGNGHALPNGSLMRIVEFLDWNREFIESLDAEFDDLASISPRINGLSARWWTIFSMT